MSNENSIRRKDVIKLAEKDPEYGRCGTCKHYQHLITCGECSKGSRYCFDWRKWYRSNNTEKKGADENV